MRRLKSLSRTAVSFTALALGAPEAAAQTQLPGITVDRAVSGATLERQPVTRNAPDVTIEQPPTRPAARSPQQTPPSTTATPASAPASPLDPNLGGDAPAVAGFAVETIGSAVAVVTSKDLRARQIRHPHDALRALPGVEVSGTGGPGTVTQVRIRGADARHTRVMIDGVELNTTTNGFFDFADLMADDIARIEVVRGPMSGLYGSGAIGGVINIVTRRPQGPLALIARTEFGSFGTRDMAVRLEGGNDKAYISIGGQYRAAKGFDISPVGSERDPNRITNFSIKAGAAFAPNARLDLVLRMTEKRVQFDDFGFAAGLPFDVAIDADNVTRTHFIVGGATLAWDSLSGKLTQEVKLGHTNQQDDNRFLPFSGFLAGIRNTTRNDSMRTNLAYSATYRFEQPVLWGRHSATGRIEGEREAFRPFSDFGFLDGDGIERTRTRLSYAGEFRSTYQNGISTTLGLRHDDNSSFRDFTTWRAAISWAVPGSGLRPHASVGTGVSLPKMYDQFGPSAAFYLANPNLRPESSFGYDAGLEWTTLGGRLVLDATYFHTTLEDRISVNYPFDLATFTFKFQPVNAIGRSTRQGVELAGKYALTPTLKIAGAYTYTDARDETGAQEPRRTPHSGRIDLTSTLLDGRATASIAALYHGTRPDRYFQSAPPYGTGITTLDATWLLQAAMSYKVTNQVEIFGRVENALNAKYQEVYGYNTSGVAAYAGMRIRFDDIAGTKQK